MCPDRKKTLAIIPVFNEEKTIARVLSDALVHTELFDLLVINDGSTDATGQIVSEHDVQVMTLPFNTGYGSALQTGFKYAFRNEYDYVIHFDGDGQHELRFLPDFIDSLSKDKADVVIGSRFLYKQDKYKYSISLMRLFVIMFMRLAINLITKLKITDPTSGFIGFNRKTFEYLISEDYPFDYPDADVIIMMHKFRLRIREIPVIMYNLKSPGKLHSGIKPLYYIYKMLLCVFVSIFSRKAVGYK